MLRYRIFTLILAALSVIGTISQSLGADLEENTELGKAFQVLVETGSEAKAKAYYKDELTPETGFQTDPRPHIDALFQYFGYAISGENLEADEPAKIMAQFPDGDVLVSRFFAPKITDVSGVAAPNYGWRKLVRIRAKSGSPAASKGLKSAFILFNVFNSELNISPFKTASGGINHSVNNQVILVRNTGTPLKPTYYLTFGAFDSADAKERGMLINYLDATFDAAAPNLPSSRVRRYYVPDACAECHGNSKGKLNYLDTDHWFDRVTNDDFDAVGVKQPLLFDSGTNDSTSKNFKVAFDVVRSLNTEIRDQNRDADGATPSFQQKAAESWLTNHATTEAHISLFERSLTATGSAKWYSTNKIDAKLLPMLNRYCFRCHSSIRYHVYDKSAVLYFKDDMIKRISTEVPEDFMPQDRVLTKETKQDLINHLRKLQE